MDVDIYVFHTAYTSKKGSDFLGLFMDFNDRLRFMSWNGWRGISILFKIVTKY